MKGSAESGRIILNRKAHIKAATSLRIAILRNDEPVDRLTAHSTGRLWQSAIISESIVACLKVRGIAIMAAIPA